MLFIGIEEPLWVATDDRKPNSYRFKEEKFTDHSNKNK